MVRLNDDRRTQIMDQQDNYQNTPLLLAAQVAKGRVLTILVLLYHQAGNREAIQIFMDMCGSDMGKRARYVNQSNMEKECPLHFACR